MPLRASTPCAPGCAELKVALHVGQRHKGIAGCRGDQLRLSRRASRPQSDEKPLYLISFHFEPYQQPVRHGAYKVPVAFQYLIGLPLKPAKFRPRLLPV